jgi:hypothetical protein
MLLSVLKENGGSIWLKIAQFPCTVPAQRKSVGITPFESVLSKIILTRSG